MNETRSNTNKKCLFGLSVLAVALIVGTVIQMNAPVVAQSTGGFNGASFEIVPDAATLSSLPAPGSTFLLTGKAFDLKSVNQATCSLSASDQLGIWRAWGQVAQDGRVLINHSLQLDALGGSIELQGTSGVTVALSPASPAVFGSNGAPFTGPTETISVVGGAGTFRSAKGEAHIRPYCQSQADTLQPFRYDRPFRFTIVEAPRRGSRQPE
jgi:hypothetical protein